jgi:hypothetical protein
MGKKVKRSFVLLTGGTDNEVDSLAIMWECLSGHTPGTATRMLQYLTARVLDHQRAPSA